MRVQTLRQTLVGSAGQASHNKCRAARLHVCRAKPDEGQDFVTKTFSGLFGQGSPASPEEMGLKRLSGAALKELYPATTDAWADPLPSDSGEVALIRQLLADTSVEERPLRLAYDAERDGWSASAFHKAVDTYGAAVVIAETVGGAVIGGYNPRGWIGLGEDRDSMAAFLFTWADGDTSRRPVKLPKVGGASQAVIDKEGSGPQFGPDGLKIPLTSESPRQAFSKLGSYYAKTPDGSKTLFADGEEVKKGRLKYTELKWLRAYVAEGDPEQWKLDGIMWTSSQ